MDDQSAIIVSQEDELKKLKIENAKINKKAISSSREDISASEIKLIATEEDLEDTRNLLKKEENKTAKQGLQVFFAEMKMIE